MAIVAIGDVVGIIQSYFTNFAMPTWCWWLILVVILAVAPFLAFRKQIKKTDNIQSQLDDIKNARPRIEVKHTTQNQRAILEVHNIGAEANFTAKARVFHSCMGPELYTMYWESNKGGTCHIDANGKESILVSGISQIDDDARNLLTNGLMLYKMGTSAEQVFGFYPKDAKSQIQGDNRYPTMAERPPISDDCVVEVTITASPQLAEPFDDQRFLLRIDRTNKGPIGLEQQTSELNSDKGDSQTE